MKRSESNVLSFLSCGALLTHENSRKSIGHFANRFVVFFIFYFKKYIIYFIFILLNRGFFSKILGFSQPEFQTFFAHSFIMEFALQHFVYDRDSLVPILRGQQELGAHTDVVEFQGNKTSTFRWTHHGARPMGFGFVNQCANCHFLQTLKPTINRKDTEVVMKCSNCNYTTTYNFPRGWNWVAKPPAKGDDRGAWIFRVEFLSDEDAMDVV